MISREEHTEGEKRQLKGVCFGLSLGTNSVLGLNIHVAGGKSPQQSAGRRSCVFNNSPRSVSVAANPNL